MKNKLTEKFRCVECNEVINKDKRLPLRVINIPDSARTPEQKKDLNQIIGYKCPYCRGKIVRIDIKNVKMKRNLPFSISWITDKLATSNIHYVRFRKLKNKIKRKKQDIKIVDVRDLEDGPGNDPGVFKKFVDKVESLIKQGYKVCVVCNCGMSRSNAVALAYLIKTGMEYGKAYNLIDEKVKLSNIDPALIEMVIDNYGGFI